MEETGTAEGKLAKASLRTEHTQYRNRTAKELIVEASGRAGESECQRSFDRVMQTI